MQGEARDVSHVRVPDNVVWSCDEFDQCGFCGRLTPRPYALICGRWVRFPPYPCDCAENRRWIKRGA